METFNVVGQYYLDVNVNVAYLYLYLVDEAKHKRIETLDIKTVKFKSNTWGGIKNKNTFKNALHLELSKPKISLKIFPKGIIHISGVKDEENVYKTIEILKEIIQRRYYWESIPTDVNLEKYYCKELDTIAYGNDTGLVVYEYSDYLYSDFNKIVQVYKSTREKVFKSGKTLKTKKLVSHNDMIDISLFLYERKNIPPRTKFNIINNELFLLYKNIKIGHIELPEYKLWGKKDFVQPLSTTFNVYEKTDRRETFDIHNINRGISLEFYMSINNIKTILNTIGVDYKINKQKVEMINCIFYFSEKHKTIFSKSQEECLPVKLQFFIDKNKKVRIRYTTKIKELNPVEYIKSILETKIEDKVVEKNDKICTLLELYEYIS